MLIENSLTGKKSFTRHNIFRDQKAKNYFTIVQFTTWKVERLYSQHRKYGLTFSKKNWTHLTHFCTTWFSRENCLSRVNCEEIEVEISRRKFQTSWMKRENNLGNWGKWRCYEVSHLLLCNNYGRAQKKLLTSPLLKRWKMEKKWNRWVQKFKFSFFLHE